MVMLLVEPAHNVVADAQSVADPYLLNALPVKMGTTLLMRLHVLVDVMLVTSWATQYVISVVTTVSIVQMPKLVLFVIPVSSRVMDSVYNNALKEHIMQMVYALLVIQHVDHVGMELVLPVIYVLQDSFYQTEPYVLTAVDLDNSKVQIVLAKHALLIVLNVLLLFHAQLVD